MPALSAASIGQISIVVKDVERAIRFYRDALGLPHLFSAAGMAFFQSGDVRLLLGLTNAQRPGPSSTLYFKVEDIEAAHRELLERGVRFSREPHMIHDAGAREHWLAFFEDGEGNTHALMEERSTVI